MYPTGDEIHEECGVVGIHAPGKEAARLTFFALHTLQHRGQEAAGIATSDDGIAHIHKGQGLVSTVFNEDNVSTLKGDLAIGHTRYSTTGGTGLRNAQPQIIETLDGPLGLAHNGNLVNANVLRRQLLERGVGLQTSSDTEVMVHLLTQAGGDWMNRIKSLMTQAEGAFALTILTRDAIYGVRDPWGFRPLVIGKLDEGYILASETCAFSAIGAEFVRELEPGEIARIDDAGLKVEQGAVPKQRSFCTFEQIYFSRPDSIHEGNLVHSTRQRLGRELAREPPADADIVVPVPDSGTPHAVGFAQETGLPYTEGLIKNRYVGRTFIEPTQKLRESRVQMKFNPLGDNLRGKRVVMVDDSIVRGTTSGPLVQMLRDAGAAEVHVRVACPAITDPCYMGVDMASQDELIAGHKTVEEICQHIGADSLAFLSIEAMMRGLEADDGYCNACFTGDYPFESEQFVQLELRPKEQFANVWGD
ncbi:MAG: amidophosphoribosyltransferase [Acidimicrobiaceae bacterium]|nr:amidophosphoribosyltransferase [Acidimicrobiaceae bacterium]MBT5848891.1 amidophosphoribosyltransferase [Acidimicrobiaceae bacterium]